MYEYKYGNKYVENTELGEKEEVLENNRAAVLDFLDTQEEYFKENGNLPSDWLDSMFFICTKLTRIKKIKLFRCRRICSRSIILF